MNLGKKAIAAGMAAGLTIMSACGVDGQESETIELTVASGIPAENVFVRDYLEPFFAEIEEATDGSVKFEHFPGGQLGSVQDAVTTVTSGVADMSYFMPGNDPGSHPMTAALTSMPGLYPSSQAGTKAIYEVSQEGPVYENDYARHGIIPLLKFATPPYEIWSTGPRIDSPDDLRDLRVRNTGGAIGEYLSFVQSNPTQMDTTEIFGALDGGVIDALALDAVNLESFSLDTLVERGTKGLALTGGTFGYIMNESAWDRLDDDQQSIVAEAAANLMDRYAQYQDENDALLKNSDQFASIEFVEMDSSTIAAWEQSFDDFKSGYLEARDDEFRQVYDDFVQRAQQ